MAETLEQKKQRARDIRKNVIPFISGEGDTITHLMASSEADNRYFAHPTVFPDNLGRIDTSKVEDPFGKASLLGELFEFNTEAEAQEFAKGSWKPNAHTAMDSLMAENERKLAKWKQDEKYTDAGTYLAWKLRDIIGEEAADALSFSFTDPLPPERVDISDEYWSNLNIDTSKQRELLSSDKYWRQKDMEAQQPSLMKELLSVFGRESKAFKY